MNATNAETNDRPPKGGKGKGRGKGPGGGKGRGPGGPRGRGGPGRRGRGRTHEPAAITTEELDTWFRENLPADWFTGPVAITHDRDEIVVIGDLAVPEPVDGEEAATTHRAAMKTFRSETRPDRIAIAAEAQEEFERIVSWGVTCGDRRKQFKSASVPVMSRLHMEERAVLDTLIDAGVARSRSEAIGWVVRLVAENEADWINRLRDAMQSVEAVRAEGPDSLK